jgi:glycerate-2-kinase
VGILASNVRGKRIAVEIDHSAIEGRYQDVAQSLINKLIRLQEKYSESTVALVSGGEASCPVNGTGLGGRNQEFVLYCAARLAGLNLPASTAVLSCGTDGIDGNSNAAGAVASPDVIRSALRQGINLEPYFRHSDSHSFFKRVGGLISTGPTGNNVRDVRILISGPKWTEKLGQ